MLELELQQYLLREYPQENARCEWKEFKNLKNSFCGDEKDDVISYVSAIANMEGGHLVIGVKDNTLEIVGTDISRLTFNGQDVLPANKTEEQKLRYVGRLLVELNEEKLIDRIGLKWILKDYNRSV